MQTAKELLQGNKLRITQSREEVLGVFLQSERALSNQIIEQQLDHIDRITLYRTLKTFEDKGLIHKVIDTSNKHKFALCVDGCSDHQHADSHVHFECESCRNTTCLNDVKTPEIHLPKGYRKSSVDVIVKGLCSNCE